MRATGTVLSGVIMDKLQKIHLGNNESLVCGVFPNQDGTFTAMTYTRSRTFKTETGARRWLERNSGE
ncbi:DUF1391 domain-containing protein [Salmonella enterica subsp. enterica serovar Enteritidis]|nr:DUF1391 domain-containing protein [Salmonella enterica subsp. enterica serovar Enteritidis]ARQ53857.1 DUF1391 domain-containing protein [Salmonella enterica subsp. enterica serovar Enteritidis]OPL36088.1 DUF1391 domain-containing protein [Salmonella enterica subsp. enterica serovar Enteritidis]OPL41087.1 DUF1391 domain-containing protein [Salmonella enterica subsp. enterica serovar Enteritidis]OPL45761.1 DUF1391 domain-containing protein [Salmonella enterica subsp. enterica serovar Enteritid